MIFEYENPENKISAYRSKTFQSMYRNEDYLSTPKYKQTISSRTNRGPTPVEKSSMNISTNMEHARRENKKYKNLLININIDSIYFGYENISEKIFDAPNYNWRFVRLSDFIQKSNLGRNKKYLDWQLGINDVRVSFIFNDSMLDLDQYTSIGDQAQNTVNKGDFTEKMGKSIILYNNCDR